LTANTSKMGALAASVSSHRLPSNPPFTVLRPVAHRSQWDKCVDKCVACVGRVLNHATNSAGEPQATPSSHEGTIWVMSGGLTSPLAAGRASHSDGVDGQAFNGPIYPTKRSGKGPGPGKKEQKEEKLESVTPSAASGK
jgi:hypothetical protein